MRFTDLVFDLYGTLVDIHTEENDLVWEKTALYFGYYGAPYTGDTLKTDFQSVMTEKESVSGQSYEVYPDIPIEPNVGFPALIIRGEVNAIELLDKTKVTQLIGGEAALRITQQP